MTFAVASLELRIRFGWDCGCLMGEFSCACLLVSVMGIIQRPVVVHFLPHTIVLSR